MFVRTSNEGGRVRRCGIGAACMGCAVFFVRVNQVLVRLWARLFGVILTGGHVLLRGKMAVLHRAASTFRGVVVRCRL